MAAQRWVNEEYADKLVRSYPRNPTFDDLLAICISPSRMMDPIQHLEIGPNAHVFSSPNSDIRFLGSFLKTLSADDYAYAESGGLPAVAVISFIGYGAASINVFYCAGRVVLNNGFHRLYALRKSGVTHVPVVIQHVVNPQFEFPPAVAGLPKEYLLGAPRPVLMKDFFEDSFSVSLAVRDRLKTVMIVTNVNQHEVPA